MLTDRLFASAEAEDILVTQQPFGDSAYIERRLVQALGWPIALHKCEALGDAEFLCRQIEHGSPDIGRFITDPIVRDSLRDAWLSLKKKNSRQGRSKQDLLAFAVRRWRYKSSEPPLVTSLNNPRRLEASGPWVWSDRSVSDPLAEEFLVLCHEAFPGLCFRNSGLPAYELAQLETGYALLKETLPGLVSNLKHVQIIVIVRDASGPGEENVFLSASQDSVGATIFLSEKALADPYLVAESLLHEATHHKLFDAWSSLPILKEAAYSQEGDKIPIPWATKHQWNSDVWEFSRALAALHVYIHLIVFFYRLHGTRPLLNISPLDDCEAAFRIDQLWRKSSFLLTELKRRADAALQALGKDLLMWLEELLNVLS
jgi:hypothetical protein